MARYSTIPPSSNSEPIMWLGRYAIFQEFAHGGFATIHLGRLIDEGESRTVAIKRLRPHFADDETATAMLIDEARVMTSIRHPNVLNSLDVLNDDDELFIVLEYVEGVTLRHLMKQANRQGQRIPLGVLVSILEGVLEGLHAAHNARGELGQPLGLIHRDVTPDNILIGVDGVPRLLDFGVARASGQFHATQNHELRGKLGYVTPEQISGGELSQVSDVFSAAVVLWEGLTGRKLFEGKNITAIVYAVLQGELPLPSAACSGEGPSVPPWLDDVVMRALEREPAARWASAREMAAALAAGGVSASCEQVAAYVRTAGAEVLAARAQQLAAIEQLSLEQLRPPSQPPPSDGVPTAPAS
jgi:serine/threonine-protein kinase